VELHYCEKCGLRIPEAELTTASHVDFKYICAKCHPHKPKLNARESSLNAPKVGSNPRLAAIAQHAPSGRHETSDKRTAKPASKPARENGPPVILLAATGGTILLVGIIFMLSSRGNSPEPRRVARSSTSESRTVPATPARNSDPPRETARPVSPLISAAESMRAAPVTNPLPQASSASADAEHGAQNTFDKLIRFEDLHESDLTVRISRLQTFVDQNSQFKVARRATLMLEQLKASQTALTRPAAPLPTAQVTQAPAPAPPANVPVPAATPAPPAQPPVAQATAKPDEGPAASEAIGVFETEFIDQLRKLDSKGALARVSKAEADASLAGVRDRIASYKRAASLLAEIDKDVVTGVEKLKEVDSFELRASRGEPMLVGKRGKFQMLEFKRDVIQLGSQGMSIPMPLDRLEKSTRVRLALLAQPRNSAGVLKSAFLNLINEDPARTSAVAEMKSFTSQAKANGVSAEDVLFIQQLADIIERDRLENAAARGWASIQKDADANRWKKVREDITAFNTQFAATRFFGRNSESIKTLHAKAIDKIEPSFYRAINLNGPPLVIDNQQWEGKDAPNLRADGINLEFQDIAVDPATDANRTKMLRSFVYKHEVSNIALLNVPTGTYSVFLYIWEDSDTQTFSLLLKDKVVRENYVSGAKGHWEKLGPWKCEISDGIIEIKATKGDANFSGVEVWRHPNPNDLR
jgi:hypothetical protein